MQAVHVKILKRQLRVATYYFRKYARCKRQKVRCEVLRLQEEYGLDQAMEWCERHMCRYLERYLHFIKRAEGLYTGKAAKSYLNRMRGRIEADLLSLKDELEQWEKDIREQAPPVEDAQV